MPESSVADAETAVDQAREAIKTGGFQTALPLLDQAIESPGLNADLYADAVAMRAVCHASAGDLEQARTDLQEAEMGAPNEALLHFAKGMVLDKEGKASEAKREFSAAKKLDPDLKKP